jgi:PAS domain S-box-containing protein
MPSSDPLHDPDRLAAVRATGLLDTPPETEFDRLTRIAARLFGTPISLLTLVEANRQFFKSSVGTPVRETNIDSSLCRFVAVRNAPLILTDAAADPRFATHLAHTELGIRSYLGIPVRSRRGHVVGSFCVADRAPRLWTDDDMSILKDLAAEAEAEVQRRERFESVSAERDLLIEVMRSSAAAVVVLNPQGQILYSNDNAEQILGIRALDVERRTFDAPAWRHTTLDGRPFPDEDQPFRRVMATGRAVKDVRHAIEWPDGTRRALSINGSPVKDAAGNIIRLVFHVHDITESLAAQEALRASEEKFSRAFRASPDAISITRVSDGRIVEINRGFTSMLGYTPEECVGRTTLDLGIWLSAEDRTRAVRTLVTHGRFHDLEVQLRHRNGHIILCQAAGELFETGGETYLVAISRDITALRAATDAESHYRRQLLQNQKLEALGTLAGGIAHDFNNLLAGILGHTEYALRMSADSEAVRENVRDIHRIGLRARELVRRILAFSRAQEAKLVPVSLNALIREHLELLRATLPATIELAIDVPPEQVMIDADTGQLHQVLLNLATNAAHAMGQRGRIEFTLRPMTFDAEFVKVNPALRPGPGVRLSVRDFGTGMSPEALAHLFEPFFTTKPHGEGTGLGLATVHALMRQHNGAITVESAADAGTTFHLHFAQSTTMPIPETPSASPPPAPKAGAGQRVLFIDDEDIVANIAQRVLKRLGYDPVVHRDPLAALADFASRPNAFQLVITDFTMPGCTGDEVVRRVLAIRPDLPVIICSGYAAGLDPDKARDIGARMMLEKPFSIDALAAAIEQCLGPKSGP